jgi:hypothetical protein
VRRSSSGCDRQVPPRVQARVEREISVCGERRDREIGPSCAQEDGLRADEDDGLAVWRERLERVQQPAPGPQATCDGAAYVTPSTVVVRSQTAVSNGGSSTTFEP